MIDVNMALPVVEKLIATNNPDITQGLYVGTCTCTYYTCIVVVYYYVYTYDSLTHVILCTALIGSLFRIAPLMGE